MSLLVENWYLKKSKGVEERGMHEAQIIHCYFGGIPPAGRLITKMSFGYFAPLRLT